VVGVIVGMMLLRALIRRLRAWQVASSRRIPKSGKTQGTVERRQFIQLAAWSSVAAAVAGVGAQVLTGASAAVTAVRTKITLPEPATAAPVVPAGAELTVPGLSPWVIPNKDFYRIDTALQVPSVDPKTWKLLITGMVENEVEITFAELLKLPLEEKYVTLACVSQEIGGNLIGNALWLGYPIRTLLERAKPKGGADMVLSRSIDGFTAGTPLAVLQDEGTDAILAVGMNGAPLPLEHGFPVRMVVPGLYGYVSATKWVVEMKVTTFAKDEGYWTPRGWSALGPVKLSSRIDTPKQGATVKSGTVAVAGVAWRQHVGVSGVQVQIDKEAWQDATLAKVVTVDSWLQWTFAWDATPGNHTISVRAIDETGEVQTAKFANPDPNGSTGHHTIQVSVS
jgi:DMSO/TMAO reductase YedYZ molybdopterin-dependent catalytic subunit